MFQAAPKLPNQNQDLTLRALEPLAATATGREADLLDGLT
jgi:hypothetical protein